MKKTFLFFLALALVAGCGQKPAQKVPTVDDECGVARKINPAEKTVYLVFTAEVSQDDGGYFENFDGVFPVLDTLASRGVKGSFFPTGNCFRAEKYHDAIARIIADGHYLSHHSNVHLHLCTEDADKTTLVSLDSLKKDTEAIEAELAKFGLQHDQYRWMIPPYEYYNAETAAYYRELGYKLCNPTEGIVTGHDWMPADAPNYSSAAEMYRNIWDYEARCETGLNGTIILIHAMCYPCRIDEDRMWWYLGQLIDTLKEKGYSFGTFSNLI